jgi:pimeloyl-ACP methyl ester carboxylesterase
MMEKHDQKISFVIVLFLTISLITSFTLTRYPSFASPENNNNTLIEPEASQGMSATNATTTTSANATNAITNIVLVHGSWVDGSFWRKVIPILQNAGHGVIAVQLPLHSLADDVAIVKRAVDLVGGPTILVGHSYGGFVITDAGYNNQNDTGLVYLAAFGPDEGNLFNLYKHCSILVLDKAFIWRSPESSEVFVWIYCFLHQKVTVYNWYGFCSAKLW